MPLSTAYKQLNLSLLTPAFFSSESVKVPFPEALDQVRYAALRGGVYVEIGLLPQRCEAH